MLNNNLSKILITCYLFANINNSNYSMEYNSIQDNDDDKWFNLIKDDNITTQQLLNTNNNKILESNTEINKNNSTQLSNQVTKLSNKVELLTQEMYRNNKKNKFIDALGNIDYIVDSKYLSIIHNLDTDSRSNLLKFLTSNFKKTKCIVANNEKQIQYLLYNEKNKIIKKLLDSKNICCKNDNYTLNKNTTNIDYFKCLNEINNIVLNSYSDIIGMLNSNLILLQENILYAEFKNSVFPSKLKLLINKTSEYLNKLHAIQQQYNKIEISVLDLLDQTNTTPIDIISKFENDNDMKKIINKYKNTEQSIEHLKKEYSLVINELNNMRKYDFVLNIMLQQIKK